MALPDTIGGSYRSEGREFEGALRQSIFFCRGLRRGGLFEFHSGYSSVGRASDCRLTQQSDGPWFDSGWPEFPRLALAYEFNFAAPLEFNFAPAAAAMLTQIYYEKNKK